MAKVICEIKKCAGCRSCELACSVEHSKSKDLFKAVTEKDKPKRRRYTSVAGKDVISFTCHHCIESPCVTACMSGAMQKDPKTGNTIHDPEKCVGCWMCMMVCPFSVIRRDQDKKIILKCDLCPDRDEPACVVHCPTGALKLEEKAK